MTGRRNVLHLIDTGGPGGAETILLTIANHLDRTRWRSIVVVPWQDWLSESLARYTIETVQIQSHGSFDLAYAGHIARLAVQHRISLIQTHLFSSAVYGTIAALPLGIPVVSTIHGQTDVAPLEKYRAAKRLILQRRRNRTVFVSHALRAWFLKAGLFSAQRSLVIQNGVSSHGRSSTRREEIRRELGAEPDHILVGAVGNLRRPKDYPTFVRAAAELLRCSPRYRFVIVGAADEPIRTELEQLCGGLGLGDRFRLAGFRPDVADVMEALDVYVLTSTSEGFSLTTVEAMAAGVPVVATRCGGPEEIVSDTEDGILVDVGNAQQLARAVQLIVDNPALRERLTRNATARALREFSTEAMVGAYARVYDDCIRDFGPYLPWR